MAATGAAALCLVLGAGCGGGSSGSPDEAFSAFILTLYDCGEENLRERYSLSAPGLADEVDEREIAPVPEDGQSVDAFVEEELRYERRDGCKPKREPSSIDVAEAESNGDDVEVSARTPGGEYDGYVGTVRDTDDGWKVADIESD